MKNNKFIMTKEFIEQSEKNFRNEEIYKNEFETLIKSLGKNNLYINSRYSHEIWTKQSNFMYMFSFDIKKQKVPYY